VFHELKTSIQNLHKAFKEDTVALVTDQGYNVPKAVAHPCVRREHLEITHFITYSASSSLRTKETYLCVV